MKNRTVHLLSVCLFLSMLQAGGRLQACTTFVFKTGDSLLFGRNYDWNIGVGFIMVNKRGFLKQALIYTDPASKPARWESRYGSITFNQYGREYPMGGMNETGLVVEVMWLEETRYPGPDARPAVSELQWVQYQLDTASSVAEVLESDGAMRIAEGSAPIHFLVSDREGNAATVEFLDGKMVAHTRDTLTVAVLANNTYETSLDYLRHHRGFGGSRPIPSTESSLDRFVRAAEVLRSFRSSPTKDLIGFSFSVLSSVRQRRGTQWSIVYDVKNLTVHFKTREAPYHKSFAFEDFRFGCQTPSKVFDMNTDRSGDVAKRFLPYSTEINRRLIIEAFGGTEFLKDTPREALDRFALYPQSFACQVKK